MAKIRFWALILLVLGIGIGYFNYYSEVNPKSSIYRPFKLGLDLSGGSQLVYKADVSKLPAGSINDAMSSLKEVIDRRINAFGVTEPVIQVEQAGLGGSSENRLVVELPGVTDVKKAAEMISATPILEFKAERPDGPEKQAIVAARKEVQSILGTSTPAEQVAKLSGIPTSTLALANQDPDFTSTGEVTGSDLSRATVSFNQNSINPSISVEFTSAGTNKFAQLTEANIGKRVGIFLDGALISAPTVREAIRDGKAEISGQFSLQEAKDLARNLNLGALPVPISLESTQTVGATLGGEALNKGIKAGIIGFIIIVIFMILWYRLPGVVASISLAIYVVIMLAIFKLIPVTLTAAGIAGFILSIGIAVDANVLIFERLKEELRRGKQVHQALEDGFSRAWSSIRDSNLSTIISSIILFWFGTSLIKGFGLNLALGVIISMFTAITVTRTLLLALGFQGEGKVARFLFSSGLTTAVKPADNK